MQNDKIKTAPTIPGPAAFKAMTGDEFQAYGAKNTVYWRTMSEDQLSDMLPDVDLAPGDVTYHVLFAADGEPVMVTDTEQVIHDWLSEHENMLARIN